VAGKKPAPLACAAGVHARMREVAMAAGSVPARFSRRYYNKARLPGRNLWKPPSTSVVGLYCVCAARRIKLAAHRS